MVSVLIELEERKKERKKERKQEYVQKTNNKSTNHPVSHNGSTKRRSASDAMRCDAITRTKEQRRMVKVQFFRIVVEEVWRSEWVKPVSGAGNKQTIAIEIFHASKNGD